MHSSLAGTWNGTGASDSELGKQVFTANIRFIKLRELTTDRVFNAKDTEEMTLRCGSSSLESVPVALVNMKQDVWDS